MLVAARLDTTQVVRDGRQPADRLAARLLAPSLSDCFFAAILIWLFVAGSGGWTFLLLDGDCGWHIRTGELILDTGSVPHTDPFSFTRPNQPWFAWEWLADVIFALLHRALGLKGVVLLAGTLIALFATVLLRLTVDAGATMLVALPVTLLATGASTVHHLARPHLFTLLLLPVSLWVLQRDRSRHSHAVWLLVPLTALWTNLHGGFLAFVACLALLAAGSAVESLWGNRHHWPAARRYTLLTVACTAASTLNPYGLHLHAHIGSYLTSGWIREVVQEFQSPRFRSENLFQFEALLLGGLVAAGSLLARKKVVETLWILFWAHSALGSVRHVPLFAVVAAPVIAVELTRLMNARAGRSSPGSVAAILADLSRERTAAFTRNSLWPVLSVAALVLAGDPVKWPQDFPEARFPVALVREFRPLLGTARVLTSDQWADYLIYTGYPRQRVFLDGRSDFYGEKLGRDYLALSSGRHDWKTLLAIHRIDTVLCPLEWPLASLLKTQPGWRILRDSGQAILFQRALSSSSSGTAAP